MILFFELRPRCSFTPRKRLALRTSGTWEAALRMLRGRYRRHNIVPYIPDVAFVTRNQRAGLRT